MSGPLDQFKVKTIVPIENIGGFDLSFTNSALWMVIAATLAVAFLLFATKGRGLVPTKTQMIAEIMYSAVADMVKDNVGSEGKKYFPFIFSLFVFILFGNLLGLVPGAFTFTSHLVVTFALAATIFIAITIIGLVKHGFRFFSLFLPEGTPWAVAIILVPIEILSYLSRPISLSVRLFANMTVGHVILKVIGGFVVGMGIFGFIPFASLIAITALELMIAVIQAYVFSILTCIYLHDSLHLH